MKDLISIVIPFYNGNKHLNNLKKIINYNYLALKDEADLEVILINDSPWIDIDINRFRGSEYSVRTYSHIKNMGIHQARVTGIEHADGNFIFMLDQDDDITSDCIISLYNYFDNATDIVFGNGVFESKDGLKLILNNYCRALAAKNKKYYYFLGNLLSSPGQCLIRKTAFPSFWLENIVKSNCADDLFLWCMLMNKNNVKYCNKIVYIHKHTGENFSLDLENGYKSDREIWEYLRKSESCDKINLKIFDLRCKRNMARLSHQRLDVKCKVYNLFEVMIKIAMILFSILYKGIGKCVPSLEDYKERN